MAALIGMPRAVWRRQPQGPVDIDWRNPIAQKLCIAMFPCGGKAFDAVSGKLFDLMGIDTSPTIHGWAFRNAQANAGDHIELPFEMFGAVSVHCIVSRDASVDFIDGKVAEVATNRSSSSQPNFWEFNLGNGFGASGDKDKPRIGGTSSTVGVIYRNGIALSGTDPADLALTNGEFQSMTVTFPNAASSGSGVTRIMGTSNLYALVGRIPIILLYNKVLNLAEAMELYLAPYQIFQPRIARFILIPSSGPVTFKPFWARLRSLIIGV